ncbi:MAG TPA: hypothetical protein VMY77_05365 [Chitinophagaceae bacterium]|nr:hypothetical protein [Chitinophagaceae bacterium]
MSEEQNIEENEPTKDSKQSTEENNVSELTTTSNKLQIPYMEVHHSHHPKHKKKWPEYLLEFFMLFLAVFLGFVAENIREHIVEGNREKQFIQSLINDITADTARMKVIINERTKREVKLDSLTFLLNNDSAVLNTNRIYYYAVTAARSLAFRFIPNDGTMLQLKNSGAFRLIRNRIVADSIAKYDVSVRNLLRQGELEEAIIHDYRAASSKIFDALVFDRILDQENNVQLPDGNPALLSYPKSDLYTWNYRTYSMKALNKASRRDVRLLLQQAVKLLNTLKKEYDLETSKK